MSDKKNVWKLSKNSNGDIILECNPQNITFVSVVKFLLMSFERTFLPFFKFFDYLASKKKLVISSVGFGIGLGLSVLASQHPDALQAFPSTAPVSQSEITAQRIVIPSIGASILVVRGNVQDILDHITVDSLVHDERSAGLGGVTPVVIAQVGTADLLANLGTVVIGDTLQIHGSNNAVYTYTVTEIRNMSAEYLSNVIGANGESIILYKPKNLLRTQLLMVIAKPVIK